MMSTPDKLDGEYWDKRYEEKLTGWDIGYPSPALTDYASQLPKDTRILIPGCGNAYEAEWLVKNGFTDVTVADISIIAIEALRSRVGAKVELIHGDFFDLTGQYDVILEQTFFCALDPSLRTNYVKKMHQLLAPGGRLAGVLFNKDFEGGPPFGGREEEYRKLFMHYFNFKVMEACNNSIAPRAGAELFVIMQRKDIN